MRPGDQSSQLVRQLKEGTKSMPCFSQANTTVVACLFFLNAPLSLIDGPLSQAEGQKEADRLTALRLFAEGAQKEREEHLMEAIG